MALSPALEALLGTALAREHAGPPRQAPWTLAPLRQACRDLFATPGKGWSTNPDRLELCANNAASWLVWQLGGNNRGLAALTVHGERLDREFGLEAALGAADTLSRKLARTGEDPVPLDAMAGRQRLGADNLTSLHRRQLHWERLRLRHAAGRISAMDLDTLASAPIEDLVNAASRVGAPAPSEPPEEGCANALCWAAGAWFWQSWERVGDPSFSWWIGDWFRATFGGERDPQRPPHGGPREANWRHEALLQIRFRTAFCLGLGTELERALVALHPVFADPEQLVAPDRAPAALRSQVAALLDEQLAPRALSLLRESDFSLPDLDRESRGALLRIFGRRRDGGLYRVDSQLERFSGKDNEARCRSLYALCRALGAAVSAQSTPDSSAGAGMPQTGQPCGHQQERARLSANMMLSAEDLHALRALVEGCPHCRAWWSEQSAGEVLAQELVARLPPRPHRSTSAAWLLLPVAAVAAATWLLWPQPPPVNTTLAGGAAVSGTILIEAPGGSKVQHPLREQDADLRLVAPAGAWVSFSPSAIVLPDADVPEATLLAWAAANGRLDLVGVEHLRRGAEGIAERTPALAPLQVQVGSGIDLVVAVLPGRVEALPTGLSARAPTEGLPPGAVVHQVRVDPAP